MRAIDGWVTLEDWCRSYEEVPSTIRSRISTGKWERGVHVSMPTPHKTFVHEERCKAWLKEKGKLK